MQEMAQLR